jgi:hypothetical protein
VPQIDLDPNYLKRTKKQVADKASEIAALNKADKNQTDAFARKLIGERLDLAGMPFLLGKDCALSAQKAKDLARCSLAMRDALATAAQTDEAGKFAPPGVDRTAHFLWEKISGKDAKVWKNPVSLPAMRQILLAESDEFRLRMVIHLTDIADPQATEILARLAVYDLDSAVRDKAVEALRPRPKAEYRATLARGLRYPWAPVVRNAAQAAATLGMDGMVPEMVALLDEPAPGNPYIEAVKDGEPKRMIRELVRVNHHRNCLLCHAPADASAPELQGATPAYPVGPVPAPDEPLPPSRSAAYYGAREGITLVRADITYLRQDFSMLQSVDHPGSWSNLQRFDFLVRTRELTEKEVSDRTPKKGVLQFLEANATVVYRETIAEALRRLTGKDAPPNARAWREALDLAESDEKPMR